MTQGPIDIRECERIAKDKGFDSMKFILFVNGNPTPCRWLDAYFGFFIIDRPGEDNGFITVGQVEEMGGEVKCLVVEDSE